MLKVYIVLSDPFQFDAMPFSENRPLDALCSFVILLLVSSTYLVWLVLVWTSLMTSRTRAASSGGSGGWWIRDEAPSGGRRILCWNACQKIANLFHHSGVHKNHDGYSNCNIKIRILRNGQPKSAENWMIHRPDGNLTCGLGFSLRCNCIARSCKCCSSNSGFKDSSRCCSGKFL